MAGYDDIIEQMKQSQAATGAAPAAPSAPANPYDSVIQQIKFDAQQSQARAATIVAASSTENPDTVAQNIALAKRYKTTPDVVATYPQEFRDRMTAEMTRQSLANAPKLQQYINDNPTSAGAFHPDVPALSALEQTANAPAPLADRTDNGLLHGLLNFSDWLSKTGGTVRDAAANAMHSTAHATNLWMGGVPVIGDKVSNLLGLSPDTPASDWWFKNMVAPEAAATAATEQPRDASFDQKVIGSVTKLGVMLGGIALSGGTTAETTAATQSPGVLSTLGQATVHALKSMWLPATTDAINTGHRVYESTGGDGAAALKAAEAQYVATTGMGLVPLSAPGGLGLRATTGFLSGVTSGEASRRLMNAASPDNMQTPFSWEDTFLSGVTGSLMGVVMGPRRDNAPVLSVIRKTYTDAAEREKAAQDFQHLSTMSELSASVKWRENDPEGFKRFTQMVTEDGNLPNVYVDAHTFMQSLDKAGITPEELKAKLPEVASDLAEASKIGATTNTVRIPTADYLTHIAGMPIDEQLLPHLKSDPEGSTFAQAKEFYQNQAEQMKDMATKLVADKTEQDAFRVSQDAVQQRIHNELDALGRQPTDVNKINATVQAAILSRIAAKEGIMPEQAHEKYGANVAGQGAGGLEQSHTLRSGQETLEKYGLPPGGKYNTRDIAAALEARQREQWGKIDPTDRSPEAAHKIANWMAEEVRFEMQHPRKSGVGWYSAKYQRALDKFGEVFPELKQGGDLPNGQKFSAKESRNLMTALIAVTSDGQKVVPNFRMAADLYKNFRETGNFSTDRDHAREASIKGNVDLIQELHDSMGAKGMAKYLLKEATVSELRQIAKKEGVDFKTDYQAHVKLPMAAVTFGPKLGAFYANLMGAHGYLTMDRWWSRTFNRYRGTLLQAPTSEGLARIKELNGHPEWSDDQAIAATIEPRKSYEAKNFKNGTELEKASNTVYKAAFENLEDAPFNATDRTFMLDAVGRAQQLLAAEGRKISVADIQAVLWYYEKRLYGELGARQSADVSYEEAAQKVAAEHQSGTEPGRPDASVDGRAEGEAGAEEVPGSADLGDTPGLEPFEPNAAGRGDADGQLNQDTHRTPEPTGSAVHDYFNELRAKGQQLYSVRVDGSGSGDGRSAGLRNRSGQEIASVGTFSPDEQHAAGLKALGYAAPVMHEINAGQHAADFHEAIDGSKVGNKFASSVYVYPQDEYAGMRLFMADGGKTGFALKGDDIVSVFNYEPANAGAADAMLDLAVQLGGKRLDAFDTVLPAIYARHGFEAVARTKWNDEYAPEGWNKDTYAKYNHGEPDVVFMAHTGTDQAYHPGDGRVFGDYDEAVAAQKAAATGELEQPARGTYNPSTRTIALLKDADLSTYLHETGHWALDTYARIAASDAAPPEIRADMDKILKWFGVESLDKWHAMSLDEQRPYHEQFARGFEAYLMEGKAPSQELTGAFSRIRAWMVDIYKSLRNLNVELTPEVRGVFDRMMASEDAIQQAQAARVFEPLFTEKPAGMSAKEWADYVDQGQAATEEAIAQMQTRSLRDMKWLSNAKSKAMRALQKDAKAARDDVQSKVEKEVGDMPVYQMEDWLKANNQTSDADKQALKEWNERRDSQREKAAEAVKAEHLAKPEAEGLKGLEKAQYVSRARREMANEVDRRMLEWKKQNKKPSIVKPEIDTELLAERFGFGSGEEAMRALAEAPPRKEVIEGLTDQRMLEQHGELSSPDAIEAAANEAVHNAARAKFMATGLKILAKSPVPARVLLNGAREAAEGAIAAKRVGDINPRQYLAAETRANKEAIKLAPTDPQGAVQAQRAALLNNQLVKAAYDAQDLVRKALAYAKSFDRISKRLKIEPEERDMIDALLARFDFRQNPPEGPTKQQLQLTQWVESQKALGYTPAEIPDMLDPQVRMHYKDMSVEQLRGLMDTIRSIEKIGRERQTVTVDGKRMDVQNAVEPMVAKMLERGEKFTDAQLAERPRYGVDPLWRVALDRVQSLLRAGMSEFLRPDYKGNKYDLHEILGPFQKAITERLFKAGYDHGDFMDQLSQLKKQRMAQYGLDKEWQKSLDTVVADHNLMDNSLETPAKRRLTRGDLIGIAMHVGNESNFDKLVQGMQWTPADIWKALHDNMSEKDWNAAKTLGELAGAKWDEVAAMNRRLGNDNPAKIEPRAFQTKFGEMPGWYAPIDYDPIRSRLGKRKADAKAVNPQDGLFSSSYYRADTTTNGSLNARASGYYDFINLDWRPIEKRINDTMRDLAYREALIDAHKIYTNKEFRSQFARSYGPEEYKHLGDWLGRLVNSEVGDEKQSVLTAISSGSRRAMVANGVAFRISTMLKHGGSAAFKSTGYFAGGGENYFGARLAAMATNHNTQVVEALAKFPEIRQRARQQDRDFAQAVGSIFEPESIHGKAERFGHAGVAAMDFFTAVPTAHAAYDWAVTEGIPKRLGGTGKPMSEADAIQFASKVVREAHGSTNEASQSLLINNKSEIIKALTTLHGFMNNAFGQTVDAYDKAFKAEGFGKPELLARTLMAQVVPAVMAGWVTFGGPNENETWAGWMLHHIGGEFAGMLPMVREGWSAGVEGFSSAGLPPWIRALTDTTKAVKSVVKGAEGEPVKHPIKDVGNAAGLLLPGLGQAGSTTQFLYDVVKGEQQPETVGEWIRGVMSGKAKHE